MYIQKNFSLVRMLKFSGGHIVWLTLWATLVTVVYEVGHWEFLQIPYLPVSIIGTAVAFYVGFKNNSAYDRLWEARKIWGAIVNSSRAWASATRAFVSDQFTKSDEQAVKDIQSKLIKRHIGWLYALRSQLLLPTEWEHVSQHRLISDTVKKRKKEFGVGLFEDEDTTNFLEKYLPKDEFERLVNYKNTATQIIDQQAQDLKNLRKLDFIDDFRHMEMQKILYDFYVHQGKCERIKNIHLFIATRYGKCFS